MEDNQEILTVRMLGGFSLSLGGRTLADSDNRSRKIWLLLAYMIYSRRRPPVQDELISLIWGDDEGSANPANALKTMSHRLRSMLDTLGEGTGRKLILRRAGGYIWNPNAPIAVDVEQFEILCAEAAAKGDEGLEEYLKALELYRGDFLPRLSSEIWVVPISAYLHDTYVRAVITAVEMLAERGRYAEAAELCRRAINVEPYNEQLYHHLMLATQNTGNNREVVNIYNNMAELFFEAFGTTPSDEIKELYKAAASNVNDKGVSISVVRDQIKEPEAAGGAYFCDYDSFKVICRSQSRALARSGGAVHIGLISAQGPTADKELSKKSLDVCMENLRATIAGSLRKGDVVAQCSVSQYVLLLPMANFENSRMVCDRVVRAFARKYPHSPARLSFAVYPLEPHI